MTSAGGGGAPWDVQGYGKYNDPVVRNPRHDGYAFALRFRDGGTRRYVTLGTPAEGWTEEKAERVLAAIRAGV